MADMEPVNVCPERDFYYCQECRGHNRCDEEVTEEPVPTFYDRADYAYLRYKEQ